MARVRHTCNSCAHESTPGGVTSVPFINTNTIVVPPCDCIYEEAPSRTNERLGPIVHNISHLSSRRMLNYTPAIVYFDDTQLISPSLSYN